MTDGDDAPKPRIRPGGRDPSFEQALGARIQAARVAAKMSQKVLGEAIGVSWQQLQKYEAGKDRVAVSTLAAIARALDVHPGSFFSDDAPPPSPRASPGPRGALSDLRSAQRIGERIIRLQDPESVRRLLALVDAMVNVQEGKASSHAPDDADP